MCLVEFVAKVSIGDNQTMVEVGSDAIRRQAITRTNTDSLLWHINASRALYRFYSMLGPSPAIGRSAQY